MKVAMRNGVLGLLASLLVVCGVSRAVADGASPKVKVVITGRIEVGPGVQSPGGKIVWAYSYSGNGEIETSTWTAGSRPTLSKELQLENPACPNCASFRPAPALRVYVTLTGYGSIDATAVLTSYGVIGAETVPTALYDLGTIRPGPPGSIAGRLHMNAMADDLPFTIVSIPALGTSVQPNAGGGYLLPGVPVGQWDVSVTVIGRGTRSVGKVTVKSGEVAIAPDFEDLRIPPRGTVPESPVP